ncbi:hypothetical protein H4Q26_000737 [Puccinia striiformis f. sp. tritici PST-130]|uniref:Uncharacterized protein n=1 Tax=Puccinia striiformis f. sp. tritici PST-78 TaxID=1165861 RepID=A0A0L0VYC1_9BASI|nr:hypothetical protein H4Q26_000737 [Puccinia striiformis f. sp. tritici PST-130]KNF04273.1 hypothetical protein PSTG_02617 [Puccinia striiformis f. sp. tritici PST-78]
MGYMCIHLIAKLGAICWNLIPSPNPRKRKNSSLTDLANKQSVHQPADDPRTSEDKQLSTQNTDSYLSQFNKRTKLNLFNRITLPPSGKCWNLIPSSNSQKRKNNSIEDLASKRSACQTADDVCQSSNFINHKLNSDFALPLELPLDHQTSRSNNEKRTSPQNPDTTLPKSNERSRSRLLKRITSPFQDHIRII